MTGWVLTISKNFPHHWDRAVEHGLWDTRRRFDLSADDTVYFWQSGQGLVGRATATTGLFEHAAADGPWDNAADGGYRYRFHLTVDADGLAVDDNPSWQRIRAETGITRGLNTAPIPVPDGADSWLEHLFAGILDDSPHRFWDEYDRPGDAGSPDRGRRPPIDVSTGGPGLDIDPDVDDRERVEVAIALRRGQTRFRNALLDAYEGRCAITGHAVPAVLEAAHISPYRGHRTHRVQNGLLLRSDLHTLFDLHRLTIGGDDLRVHVAPELRASPYGAWEGAALRQPSPVSLRPSPVLLRRHNQKCSGWLGP